MWTTPAGSTRPSDGVPAVASACSQGWTRFFFHLYGVTNRDDIRHIYSTFPIQERREQATYGRYVTRNLCLAYVNALAAGQPDAEPDV